jgi:MFS family permease
VITRTFPPERRSAAMSLWGAVAGLANLVGPLLGGVLVDGPGWEWIFFLNLPVSVLAFALAVRFVPALPVHGHSFDVLGVVLSGTGMFLVVFGIQEGGSRDWDGGTALVIAAGLAVLAGFVGQQARRGDAALLPLSIFRDRNFALAALAVAAAAGAVAAVLVPLYFYLEGARDMAGSHAALLLAPMAVCAIVFVPLVGRFGDRLHPRLVPTVGFALFAGTLVAFALLMTPSSPIGLFVLLSALAGVANACLWPSLAVTATHALPPDRAGAGAGAYNALRQVGSAVGIAAIGATVAARLAAHHLSGNPVAPGGSAGGSGGTVPESVRAAFGAALGEAMSLPIALLVVGLVAAALFRRDTAARPPVTAAARGGDR